MRHALRLAPACLFTVLAFALVACSDDEDETTKQTSPTTPSADAKKDAGNGGSSSSKLGPNCTAYVACCEELSDKQPQLASACDSTKSSLESASDASTLETSCKSGVDAFKAQGYCK